MTVIRVGHIDVGLRLGSGWGMTNASRPKRFASDVCMHACMHMTDRKRLARWRVISGSR